MFICSILERLSPELRGGVTMHDASWSQILSAIQERYGNK